MSLYVESSEMGPTSKFGLLSRGRENLSLVVSATMEFFQVSGCLHFRVPDETDPFDPLLALVISRLAVPCKPRDLASESSFDPARPEVGGHGPPSIGAYSEWTRQLMGRT
jgi:hypothetical protein